MELKASKTMKLFEVNLKLNKGMTKSSILTSLIYILMGFNPILFAYIDPSQTLPIPYVTVLTLFHVYFVKMFQVMRQVSIRNNQLAVYPISNFTLVQFLFMNELFNLRIVTFAIPMACGVVSYVMHQQLAGVLYFLLITIIIYLVLNLYLLLVNLLVNQFSIIYKPLQLAKALLLVAVIRNRKFLLDISLADLSYIEKTLLLIMWIAMGICLYAISYVIINYRKSWKVLAE